METIGFVFGMTGMSFGLMGFIFGINASGSAEAATGKIERLEARLVEAGVVEREKDPD